MNNQLVSLLKLAGLTPEQTTIYDVLLQNKQLPASTIARLSNIERSLTYKILGQLTKLKLVEKHDIPDKISAFTACHPQQVLEIIKKKKEEAENAYEEIHRDIGKVIAAYNLSEGKPNIRFIEGIEGIRFINKDILSTETTVRLIRSAIDKENPESHALIREQIEKRIKKGITTKIVGPLPAGKDTDIAALQKEDKEKIVDRRVIDEFKIPAQVLIYGNKVAITDYKNNVVTTIIENESVRESFEKIFDYMFDKSRKL